MKQFSNQALFIFFSIILVYLLYLLSPILTPFLLSALLAYLTSPLVSRMDKRLPHLCSVSLVFVLLFSALTLLVLIIVPLIQNQIRTFIEFLPTIIDWVQQSLIPWLKEVVDVESLKTTFYNFLPKSGLVLSTVLKSGYAVVEWIINLILIPVVTFYLLRDWDSILHHIRTSLPTPFQSTIVQLAKACDSVLSAFFRGQLLIMLALCALYSIGLTLVGLKVGLIIGLIGGILCIVPFVGSLFVLITASLTAYLQFNSWQPVIGVLVVYLIGQIIEGYVLTPYLIGKRIGLHPVAVIFSIMAGGTLFGFFGILIALPAAAIIVVLLQFLSRQNLFSS